MTEQKRKAYTVEQLATLQDRAAARKKVQKRFLVRLKKNPPKNLDRLFQEAHERIFPKYDCTVCANCCKTAGPRFTERDIGRMARFWGIKEADFIERYLHRDEDEDWVFRQLPCPFLLENNLCCAYEARTKACREYPHTDAKGMKILLNITFRNIRICPAVYEIVEDLRARFSG